MTTKQNILTPTGRIVWGDLYEPQTKDADGKPLVIKNGPDAGKPTQRYAFGVAIAKTPGKMWWDEPWGLLIYQVGAAMFPQPVANAVAAIMAGHDPSKYFAFKVQDGDSTVPNKNGKKNCDKEGYPGHWVLSFSSSYAPRLYNRDGSAPILEPGAIKAGYFVQVSGTVDGNNSTQNPGVYLNHGMVALQGYGPEIVSGPDPTAVGFGGGTAPSNMSATPPAGMKAPPVPGAVATPAVVAPPVVAAPPAAPMAPGAPAVAVAPAPSFLAPPAAPAAPTPPAAPAVPQMTAKAAGASYADFKGKGWTDDQMRAQGYIV